MKLRLLRERRGGSSLGPGALSHWDLAFVCIATSAALLRFVSNLDFAIILFFNISLSFYFRFVSSKPNTVVLLLVLV